MTDVLSPAERSRVMSRVRSRDTRPELMVRRLLHRAGFRYGLTARHLPGSPDLSLPRYDAVIFVHGCFWHGHDCPAFRMPSSRRRYWKAKIARNQARDAAALAALAARGLRAACVWECALRGPARLPPEAVLARLAAWLRGRRRRLDLRGR
jgi:DNA mismatch endonuclease (patch repair protein)